MRFGLPAHLPEAVEKTIKRADRVSAYYEAIQLAGFSEAEARKLFGSPRSIIGIELSVMTSKQAQKAYKDSFVWLTQDMLTRL